MTGTVTQTTPRGAQSLYVALLGFYWLLQYVAGFEEEIERGGLLYYLYVLPVASITILLLLLLRRLRRDDGPALWMAAFVVSITLISIVRGDFQTVGNVGLLGCTMFVVLVYRVTPSAGLLNLFLLLSIPMGAVFFALGGSQYFVVPGVATSDLWWRVSLFPRVAPSAFFAAVVLLVNLANRRAPWRSLCLPLALYFLVLSGIRSALIGMLLAYGYHFLVSRGWLRRTGAKMMYLPLATVFFVAFLLADQLLLLLPDLGGGFLTDYLFRSSGNLQDENELARTIYRTWIWSQHLLIASQNPIFGVGTFDFAGLSTYDPFGGAGSQGSESFLTGMYARVGISTLFLIAALVNAILRGLNARRDLHMMIGILLFVTMLAYGSIVNAYDFVFLVILGLLAGPMPEGRKNEMEEAK